MTLKASLRSYYELYQSIPDPHKRFSDKEIPQIVSSINERVSDLKKSLESASKQQELTSRLEQLCLHNCDLPQKSPISQLEIKRLSHLDIHSPIFEDFSRSLQLGSEDTLVRNLQQATRFVTSSIGGHHLARNVHFFFHSTACGLHIQHVRDLDQGTFGLVEVVKLGNRVFARKRPKLKDFSDFATEREEVNQAFRHSLYCQDDVYNSFVRERETLLKLRHRNIVSLSAVMAHSIPSISLYLELAHSSLFTFLLERPQGLNHFIIVDQQLRYKIFRGLVAGVAYLHKKNIIHKDLKRNNVLLTQDLIAKVCDFGFATLFNTKQSTTLCASYAAPESIFPDHITDKIDVWSVGVMLFELFKKRSPYPMEDNEKGQDYRNRLYEALCLKKCAINPLVRVESHWEPHDPKGVWRTILRRILEPNYFKRPSMEEVYKLLIKHRDKFSIQATS